MTHAADCEWWEGFRCSKGCEMRGWQPIDTAPRDGRRIEVAWIVNQPTVEVVKRTHWEYGHWYGHWTPTHWRPLPSR